MEKEKLDHSAETEEETAADESREEEDTGAEIAPIIKLDAVAVSTGEEDEDVLIDLKAKLYRFDKEGNQWKERGVGQVKILKHKNTEKIRLLMRQNKTLKICANHTVLPSITLQEHQGSDKTWVWHASDFSDGELKDELFCIRFGGVENAQAFKKTFEESQKLMSIKLASTTEKETESVGELLENLKVDDTKEEGKAEKEGEVRDTTKPSELNEEEK